MKTSILIIINHSGKEAALGVDMALAASAFDTTLSILFQGKGIKLLTLSEKESTLQKKIKAWPWYDIENIYIDQPLAASSQLLPASVVPAYDLDSFIEQHELVLYY